MTFQSVQKGNAIHPGIMRSIKDGDNHYIGYMQLIELYCLDPRECVLWDDHRPETYRARRYEDYRHYWPKYSGNYPVFKKALAGEVA